MLNRSWPSAEPSQPGWCSQVDVHTSKRTPVTISLLDEADSPTMVWTMVNAWPTKVTRSDRASEGSDVAIESIEFAHEGLTIDGPCG